MMQWFVFFALSFEQMSGQTSLAQVQPSPIKASQGHCMIASSLEQVETCLKIVMQ
jgi:hypothetical protein